MPADHFTDEDDILLARLYNSILTNNSLSETEIIEWANGINETTVSDNIDGNYELANVEIILNLTQVENSKNLNDVINFFNMIIEWAEKNDLPNNEILALQRITEKTVIKKYL